MTVHVKLHSSRLNKDYSGEVYLKEEAVIITHTFLETLFWSLPDEERPRLIYTNIDYLRGDTLKEYLVFAVAAEMQKDKFISSTVGELTVEEYKRSDAIVRANPIKICQNRAFDILVLRYLQMQVMEGDLADARNKLYSDREVTGLNSYDRQEIEATISSWNQDDRVPITTPVIENRPSNPQDSSVEAEKPEPDVNSDQERAEKATAGQGEATQGYPGRQDPFYGQIPPQFVQQPYRMPEAQAPSIQAPPVQAPPVQAPSIQAPPVQAPSVQAPPVQTPFSAPSANSPLPWLSGQGQQPSRTIIPEGMPSMMGAPSARSMDAPKPPMPGMPGMRASVIELRYNMATDRPVIYTTLGTVEFDKKTHRFVNSTFTILNGEEADRLYKEACRFAGKNLDEYTGAMLDANLIK